MEQYNNDCVQYHQTDSEMVKEFHETFGHPVAIAPTQIPVDRVRLRLNLILEEVGELVAAQTKGPDSSPFLSQAIKLVNEAMLAINTASEAEFETDLVETADALTDTIYVVQGAGHEFGLDLQSCMVEVHDSNMSKLGEDGKPLYNEVGKVMKGPNYRPPNLRAVLRLEAERLEEAA